jgi:membrane-associated protein
MATIKPGYRIIIGVVIVLALCLILQKVFSVDKIFAAGGIIGLSLTVFAETGLLAGFFLPGDTLLFAAGFLASQHQLSLTVTLIGLFLGAVAGNMAGYEIGRRNGHKLFRKPDAIFFHKENIDRAQQFFRDHGGKTIILARFVPIVRTLSSPLAGMSHMNYGKFMLYNIIGALLWVPTIVLVGYWVGQKIGEHINIDHYILPVALLAMILTFGGSFAHVLRDADTRQKILKKIRDSF